MGGAESRQEAAKIAIDAERWREWPMLRRHGEGACGVPKFFETALQRARASSRKRAATPMRVASARL